MCSVFSPNMDWKKEKKTIFFDIKCHDSYLMKCLHNNIIVGNPNRKKMHIFGFVGIFEYIC